MTALSRNIHLLKGCYSKTQYISVDEALEKIRWQREHRGKELYWYRCPHCNAIHLTKRANNNPR